MIGLKITGFRNAPALKEFIDELPRRVRGLASRDAAIYLIGNERRGLQHYPQQAPKVKYRRTYNYRFGWQWTDEGVNSRVFNDVEYAIYPRTRFSGAPWNWRTIEDIWESNTSGMIQEIEKAVQRYIDSNQPK